MNGRSYRRKLQQCTIQTTTACTAAIEPASRRLKYTILDLVVYAHAQLSSSSATSAGALLAKFSHVCPVAGTCYRCPVVACFSVLTDKTPTLELQCDMTGISSSCVLYCMVAILIVKYVPSDSRIDGRKATRRVPRRRKKIAVDKNWTPNVGKPNEAHNHQAVIFPKTMVRFHSHGLDVYRTPADPRPSVHFEGESCWRMPSK